ncbi:MAG: hypothetical protein EAZ16_11970 [Sphingobacteriales bacterium]|nr:MAG: hypothetical protein EAZ16_11970 [Sphingobacteriales bacterium]
MIAVFTGGGATAVSAADLLAMGAGFTIFCAGLQEKNRLLMAKNVQKVNSNFMSQKYGGLQNINHF